MQWILMASAIFSFMHFEGKHRWINLILGVLLVFASFYSHKLRGYYMVSIAENLKRTVESRRLSNPSRRAKREAAQKSIKARENTGLHGFKGSIN